MNEVEESNNVCKRILVPAPTGGEARVGREGEDEGNPLSLAGGGLVGWASFAKRRDWTDESCSSGGASRTRTCSTSLVFYGRPFSWNMSENRNGRFASLPLVFPSRGNGWLAGWIGRCFPRPFLLAHTFPPFL